MAPVLILQFMADDGPAFLGTWLRRHGIGADVRCAASGAVFPEEIGGYRALALLGGAMSVNDEHPFLRTAERLIGQAMARDVPVLGHCLGGQLMARALGAKVAASPAPEIGWQRVEWFDSPQGRAWFGPQPAHHVFHWHYEAFDLPSQAVPLATNPACRHQAFSIGVHLALQFHLEVDDPKVRLWLSQAEPEYLEAQRHHASVHGEQRVRDDTARHLRAQQRMADHVYEQWLQPTGVLS
ncbi:MAG: type 1 glutamine amidotransferase [Burkholderiaceae bacterium]|nr:type 1 glutamine amidotransferase [Burkholderiaceae bacterium]